MRWAGLLYGTSRPHAPTMSQDSDETMILDGSCSPSLLSQGRSLFYQEEEEEAHHHLPLPLSSQEQPEEQQYGGCHGNNNVLHEEEGGGSSLLVWIQKEQENIEGQFIQTDQLISIPMVEKKLRDIEGSLKEVSVRNQKERKELASFCNTSSTANGGDIKKKLISLTNRQKTLLSCFKKQTTLLDQLKQVKSNNDSAVAMETNNPPIEDTCVAMETANPVAQAVATNPVLAPTARAEVRPKPVSSVPATVSSLSQPEGSSSSNNNNEASLSQPVPLDTLIRQGFLTIRDKLTCQLMGCTFEASLTSDGHLIESSNGSRYPSPQSWQNACWSVLGHQKKVKKIGAYKTVYCRNQSLSSICESYSLRQISLYKQKMQVNSISTSSTTSAIATDKLPEIIQQFDLNRFLENCRVLPHQLPKERDPLLSLPEGFWGSWSFDSVLLSPTVKQLEVEVDNWMLS